MNSPDSASFDSHFDELAAEWLFERDEGFAPGRAEAFAQWFKADPRHAAAVTRVEQTLILLGDLPSVRGPLESRVGRVSVPQSSPGRIRRRTFLLGSLGLAAALVVGVIAWRGLANSVESFAATSAEPRRIALEDGSVMDLNASSKVQVEFSKDERRVALSEGEAHFQVAHNAARPFIVTAHNVRIRAVGTAFNVRLNGDEVDVLVTEGRVEVDRANTPASRSAPILPMLAAGEQMVVSAASDEIPQIEPVPPVAVHEMLSWQDRMTNFSDVPLREMVARINRCNGTKLVLDDPQLGDRRIGGIIDLGQVEAFVHLLEQDGDIVAERRFDGEIVLRRAR